MVSRYDSQSIGRCQFPLLVAVIYSQSLITRWCVLPPADVAW